MSNYATLKSAIQSVIRTNGNEEITGTVLQNTLISIVDSIGKNYTFVGVATPQTNAGSPDQNVVYIGGSGTYTNFGSSYTVPLGCIGVFTFNGAWNRESIDVAGEAVRDLENFVAETVSNSETDVLTKLSKHGINLYDPEDEDIILGHYLDYRGNSVANASYMVTGYIPITKEVGNLIATINYGEMSGGGGFICYYDKNKTFLSGVQGSTTTPNNCATWSAGVAYVRFSIVNYTRGPIQIERGTSYTGYRAYGSSRYTQSIVQASDAEFMTVNLYDPEDEDIILDHYLDYHGNSVANASYMVTGYIPITKEVGNLIATINYGETSGGGGFICYYDKNKTFLSGVQGSTTTPSNCATWSAGVAYVRFSIVNYTRGPIQIERGTSYTAYVDYGGSVIPDIHIPFNAKMCRYQLPSLIGQAASIEYIDSITAGTLRQFTSQPYYIKKNVGLCIYADITSFETIYFGKGYNTYRGGWAKIDATNITIQRYENETINVAVDAHGLTIAGFVKIVIYINNGGAMYVILQSESGTFTKTYNTYGNELNGQTFVRSEGNTVLSGVKVDYTCADYRCPVWAVGDSYFGMTDNRWPGVMREYGFINFLINGLSGQTSNNAYDDLLRMLDYGTPKYLLWCLGMNDTDNYYELYFNRVRGYCERHGITMIAATIPSVPTRAKEYISNLVKSSGLRFIDFYKAVGADAEGVWYDGYLSSDGVHPTALGARALATQVLVDFPELMQYGKV